MTLLDEGGDVRHLAAVWGASLLVVVVLVVGGGTLGMTLGRGSSMPGHMSGFSIDGLPPEVAGHYRFAASHLREFSLIPCYCGCQNMLGHRSLADCFVRPEGGWEQHAAGCGICLGEAAMARSLLEEGRSPPQVAEAVIDSYEVSVPMPSPATT